ncbi:MAG: hypothetical protein ACRDPK_19380 [Carbonactinosporaceae bacterium]
MARDERHRPLARARERIAGAASIYPPFALDVADRATRLLDDV